MVKTMESTLERAKFLALISEWGHASSTEMVETVLREMGWSDKQAFTKGDVVTVLDAVTTYAQEQVQTNSAAVAGATDEQRAHLVNLIDAVRQSAVPLLKQNIADEG